MRKLFTGFALVLILSVFTACTGAPDTELLDDTVLLNPFSRHAFDNLDETEQVLYREISHVIENMEEQIQVSSIDDALISNIYTAVLADHPEYFYISGYETNSFGTDGVVSYIDFHPIYTAEIDELEWRKEKIASKVSGIVDIASDKPNEYEKAKYIYETIVRTTAYELDSPESQNLYSVFNNGVSVCAGYAKATQYLLNELGITATYVTGTDLNGTSHAWNMVKIDGEYYHMDTTFADPAFPSGTDTTIKPDIFYDYLLMTERFALNTRIIAQGQNLPPATSVTANYFTVNGNLFTEYNTELLYPVFQKSLEKNQNFVSLFFESDEVYDTAIKALFTEKDIVPLLEKCRLSGFYMVESDQVNYFADPDTNIITIMLY